MSREEIEARIPHRVPMLLLDAIVGETEDSIVCLKTFEAEEYFFQGHYPDQPIVPGVILCESAMQAGAVLLSKQMEGADGVPVATRLNNVKFKQVIQPGDTVRLEVQLTERLGDAFFLTAKVICRDRAAVRFDFACTMTNKVS